MTTTRDTAPDAVSEPDALVSYRPLSGSYDEMIDPRGVRRRHWERVGASIGSLTASELRSSADEAQRLLESDGVSYNPAARDSTNRWNLDPVPTIISSDEWAGLETAIAQRAQLLDLILCDLYGPRDLIKHGLIPPEVVYGHPGFLRECDGIRIPGSHQLFLTATNIARDDEGQRVALSDRTQAPSGAGYALENRTVVSRVFSRIYRDTEVHRLAPFFRTLRSSLRLVAPAHVDVPRVVLLTPGPRSETAFEHAMLASYLGYPLVKGPDLRVRDGQVWMQTLGRLEPVHVILRRVDAGYCDPLELRPDSQLGVPGLLEACRLGNVSIVNTVGSGVLENPALLPLLPALAHHLLDESLKLPSVATWWCGEPTSLSHVLTNLHQLVIKPITRDGTPSTLLGWELDKTTLDALAHRIQADPNGWVGQDPVAISGCPTLVGDTIEARRSVLRTFAVSTDDGYTVMPGGLTRVATDLASTLITNQTGAFSKDTWVISEAPEALTGFWLHSGPAVEPEASMSSRAVENLFWLSRYAERAEGFVRLLRVVADRRNEFASGTTPAGDACVDILLGALTCVSGTFPGFVGPDGTELRGQPNPELRSLMCDGERVGTLAFNVARMLEAASEVRDQLSTDTWLVIGHLDRDLAALDTQFADGSAQAALGRVMQGMLALSGLSAESMVRDVGWQFMDIGRRIERALQLCQLLAATVLASGDTATDSLVLESTLTTAESIITYRRRYRGRAQIATVLDLIVTDENNPRSLAYQLMTLTNQLTALAAATATGTSLEPAAESAERIIAEVLANIRSADTAVLAQVSDASRPALAHFLSDAINGLSTAATDLASGHFTRQLPQRTAFMHNDPGRR